MPRTLRTFSLELRKTGKNKYPISPSVVLTIQRWHVTDKGVPTISAQLMTDDEIDHCILALKSDLDRVAKAAKAALKKHHPKRKSGKNS